MFRVYINLPGDTKYRNWILNRPAWCRSWQRHRATLQPLKVKFGETYFFSSRCLSELSCSKRFKKDRVHLHFFLTKELHLSFFCLSSQCWCDSDSGGIPILHSTNSECPTSAFGGWKILSPIILKENAWQRHSSTSNVLGRAWGYNFN